MRCRAKAASYVAFDGRLPHRHDHRIGLIGYICTFIAVLRAPLAALLKIRSATESRERGDSVLSQSTRASAVTGLHIKKPWTASQARSLSQSILLLILDTLGDDLQPEIVGQLYHRGGDGSIQIVGQDTVDEGPIDFKRVDREFLNQGTA